VPPRIDLEAIGRPAICFEGLPESREAFLPFGIVLRARHEHSDPPHALGLLGTGDERPYARCADKRD
jgi:hypothetical protein